MAKLQHLVAGTGVFAGAVYTGWHWAKQQQDLPKTIAAAAGRASTADGQCSGCAFDRLAEVYDDVVGREESVMSMGLLRWCLLRGAQGHVLEVSAGTGRNLAHLPYSSIQSVTLTDISTNMLQQAQRKFFDELQLQYKQPDLTCRFMLADAQNMVAPPGEQPQTVLLPPPPRTQQHSSAPSSSRSAAAEPAKPTGSIWRLKQPSSSSSSSSSSSQSDDGAGSSSSSLTDASSPGVAAADAAASSDSTGGAASSSRDSGPSSSSSRRWRWSKQPNTPAAGDTNSSSSSVATPQPAGSTFAPHSFDTVIDTFGLCSCEDPVGLLQQAAQLLKPGGKLLLLQHGRGTWGWANWYIDKTAESHYKTFGCWYDKDILGIVRDAGLQVDWLFRWHFGTTYLIVATPAQHKADADAAQAA